MQSVSDRAGAGTRSHRRLNDAQDDSRQGGESNELIEYEPVKRALPMPAVRAGPRAVHLGHRAGAQRSALSSATRSTSCWRSTTTRAASRSWSPTAARPTRRARSSPATPGGIRRSGCWTTQAGCRVRAATSPSAPLAARSCSWWTAIAPGRPVAPGRGGVGLRAQRGRLPGPAAAARRDRRERFPAGRRRRAGVAAGPPSRFAHLLRPRGLRAAAERGRRLSPLGVREGRPVRRGVRRLRGRGVQPPRRRRRPALLLHAARRRELLSARHAGRPVPADDALRPRPRPAAAQAPRHVFAAGLPAGGVPVRRRCWGR